MIPGEGTNTRWRSVEIRSNTIEISAAFLSLFMLLIVVFVFLVDTFPYATDDERCWSVVRLGSKRSPTVADHVIETHPVIWWLTAVGLAGAPCSFAVMCLCAVIRATYCVWIGKGAKPKKTRAMTIAICTFVMLFIVPFVYVAYVIASPSHVKRAYPNHAGLFPASWIFVTWDGRSIPSDGPEVWRRIPHDRYKTERLAEWRRERRERAAR